MDDPPEPLILITTLTLASSGRQDGNDEEEAIAALSLQKAWRYVAERIGSLFIFSIHRWGEGETPSMYTFGGE